MTAECPFKVGDKVTVCDCGWDRGPCDTRTVVKIKRRPEVVELDDKSEWRWTGYQRGASLSSARIRSPQPEDDAAILRLRVASRAAAMRKEDWLKLSDEDIAAVDAALRRAKEK